MKKIKIIAIISLLSNLSYSQTFPVGNPPAPFTLPNQAQSAWYRGGNFPIGASPPTSNVFGTMFNAAIHTKTNSILRMKLNGTVAYNINGFVAARDGYMLLGPDAPVAGGPGTYYNNKGAFSLLHLNGTTTALSIELGYRPWMKTGITFTENSDLIYVGRKSEGTGPSTIYHIMGYHPSKGLIVFSDLTMDKYIVIPNNLGICIYNTFTVNELTQEVY